MTENQFKPAVFQSFEEKADPSQVAPRIAALRSAMQKAGIDAFLIPRADAHRGESVPASEARLAYVTGFTGSAGMAVVGTDKAGLFVDSRYTLQAPTQTDTELVSVHEVNQGGISPDIRLYVPRGGKLAYDPWLHTPGEIRDLTAKLAGYAKAVPHANLVDAIWTDRPAPPVSAIEFLGHNRAGQSAADKIAALREILAADKAEAVQGLQARGARVAMVGDGVNDAPALAQADLGIAIGTGADVAREASDLTVVSGDLRAAADAIALSRRTYGVIRGNLFWAFAYNVCLVPVAAGVLYPAYGVLLSPVLAAGAMVFSSVFVLTNALRLKRFRPVAGAGAGGNEPVRAGQSREVRA